MNPASPQDPQRPAPRRSSASATAPLLLLLLALAAPSPAQSQVPDPKPDFQLQDVNSRSSRKAAMVSSRDYRLQIAAYYFGAAG